MLLDALVCIATAVYFEARDQSWQGQAAVAQVILHRVESPHYPDTACGVVTQDEHRRNKCQFSYMCDGKREDIHNTVAFKKATLISVVATLGLVPDVTDGATHYHSKKVSPWWADYLLPTTQIEDHIFYKRVGE